MVGIRIMDAHILFERTPGTLPANTEVNPREHVNTISVTIVEKIPTAKKEAMIIEEGISGKKDEDKDKRKSTRANYKLKIPFPKSFVQVHNQDDVREFIKIFRQLKINLPLCDLLLQETPMKKGKGKPRKKHKENRRQILQIKELLSLAARKWVVDRESLKKIIEKSFDESIIEHFNLEHLFVGLDWDLETIISTVKGFRIILTKEHLASILGIEDEGNSVTVDSKKKTIDENPDWSYDVACNRFDIHPHLMDHRVSSMVVIFPLFSLVPSLISSVIFVSFTSICLISFTIAPPSLLVP
ncbi:hypothetical protein M9H77_13003 [Catharanthus roseus]|uniref:Uncharacterized protein n=1 Tax=Catharanthus roseus TaxID=4058 RepID=A0ACC0BJ74_CATRO|nr:hypothetical protein M9H77_13003 [Catharanthus roseus]